MNGYTYWKDENGVSEFLWPKQQRDMAIYSQTSNIVIPSALQLDFAVDKEKMEKAIQSTFDAYSVLRALLYVNDGKYYYRIVDNYKYKLSYFEAEGDTAEERFNNGLEIINKITSQPLDFTKEFSLKVGLIRTDEEQYILYIVGHPLIADGTSAMVAIDQIMSVYFDRPRKIPDGIQYHEFAKRCLAYEQSEKGKKDQKYWDDELAGYAPYDITKWYEGRKADVSEYTQPIDYELFRDTAKKFRTSIYNIVVLGIHLGIHISLGIDDTTVVVPSSCRMNKDEMYIVGNLARNMPQRMTFGTDAKLSDLLDKSVRKISKNILHHHAGSLELSCQVTLSYNNFRGGLTPEFKVITMQVGNDTRVTRDQIVTLIELDETLSLYYGFDHRISYETLCFLTKTVNLTAKLLMENPEITVEEMAELLRR